MNFPRSQLFVDSKAVVRDFFFNVILGFSHFRLNESASLAAARTLSASDCRTLRGRCHF